MKRIRPGSRIQLPKTFYQDDTVTVSRNLVGKVLEHNSPQGCMSVIINETEAYTQDQPSCHAFKGKSKRNRAMFEEAGAIYIYQIYGIHRCINFVTQVADRGCAVLLRGVLPLRGTEYFEGKAKKVQTLLNGPSKLMKTMRIPLDYYGMSLLDQDCPIKIYDEGYTPVNMQETPRIGISQARDLPWRFIAKSFKKEESKEEDE